MTEEQTGEPQTGARALGAQFLSYSSVDGDEFATKLADALADGVPPVRVWGDWRDLRPGENWHEQIVEAIRECDTLLFVMTRDSVRADSVCTQEWIRARRYKSPSYPSGCTATLTCPSYSNRESMLTSRATSTPGSSGGTPRWVVGDSLASSGTF